MKLVCTTAANIDLCNQVETDRAFTYARRSTYGTSIDVRFSAIFHGLMAVIKAYFLVDKSSIK